jgi:hypothetical protein
MHIWEKDAEFHPITNEATERIIALWNERMGKITTK